MTDLGDSKDDAESLLEQLKEFTDKSMVSGTVLECLLERKVVFTRAFQRKRPSWNFGFVFFFVQPQFAIL